MQFGAAEDVVRAPDLPSAKAKMTMLRLAGFSSVRVTSQWQGTEAAPSAAEIAILRNVAGAAQLSAVRVYLAVYPTGSRVTPLTPEARELFAGLRDGAEAAAALRQGRDRRQRTEPQPLLAAAVQSRRNQRSGACLPRAARPFVRRAQGGRSDDARLGRRPRAAWHRPARDRPRHALTGQVPEGHGRRLPRRRPDVAGDGRPRVPPLRRLVRSVARHATPELDDDRPRRLRPPDQDARYRLRRQPAGRHDPPDPVRRVRGRVDRSRRARRGRTPARSRRRRGRSTRSPRARTTSGPCSLRSASRT